MIQDTKTQTAPERCVTTIPGPAQSPLKPWQERRMDTPNDTGARESKRVRRGKNAASAAPLTDDEQRVLSRGIAFLMFCAAAISFPTIYGLARLIGFDYRLAYLLPAAIDGYAVTSIWFGRKVRASHPAARAARRNSRLALAITVACNGLYHLLTLGGTLIPVWARITLLVAVSSLPPFLVDRLLHLRSLAAGNTTLPVASVAQATGNTAPKATPPAVAREETPTPATVADPQAAAGAERAAATGQRGAEATPHDRVTQPHAGPIRLRTSVEKEEIVEKLLAEHGDDMSLRVIADAIGTKHTATALKVRNRVIKARTEPKPAPRDAAEEPEPALGAAS